LKPAENTVLVQALYIAGRKTHDSQGRWFKVTYDVRSKTKQAEEEN
jgi:hypothetical protein